jgi:hypothetical protein
VYKKVTSETTINLERPTVKMSIAEFDALLEYSTTLPTGTTIGKKWKRHILSGLNRGEWWLGEYVPDPSGSSGKVGITWKKIETPTLIEEEIKRLLVTYEVTTQRLNELGICPKDGEAMPCMTCGAGL